MKTAMWPSTSGVPSDFGGAAREATGLPVMVCDDPISAVLLGSGKALEHLELLKEVTLSWSARRSARGEDARSPMRLAAPGGG